MAEVAFSRGKEVVELERCTGDEELVAFVAVTPAAAVEE